jgi:hypothetical protein
MRESERRWENHREPASDHSLGSVDRVSASMPERNTGE